MNTGIELIAQERQEQIKKHGRTVEQDVELNKDCQLTAAADTLITKDWTYCYGTTDDLVPDGWDFKIFAKMYNKPYKERLIIAGALIAAELDRLQKIEEAANG